MPNDSSTGGYLSPISINGDLNDNALGDFLQGVVVGITGMSGTLVRPRWQPEPPAFPTVGTNWAGIGVTSRRPDKFAYIKHEPAFQGFDRMYRQEIIEVLCSFYGPNAEANCELLSIGFQVAQNLEAMKLQGFGLIEVDDPLSLGELINERFLYRVDLGFKLRRVQIYDFAVFNLLGATGTVQEDSGLPNQPLTVNYVTVVNPPIFAFNVRSEFFDGFDKGNIH